MCWLKQARLAQIDLFSELGGVREASVQRYKEKRRNRLFSKKIRYQVRKLNADRRPRMKVPFLISSFLCLFSNIENKNTKPFFVWLTRLDWVIGVSAQSPCFCFGLSWLFIFDHLIFIYNFYFDILDANVQDVQISNFHLKCMNLLVYFQ